MQPKVDFKAFVKSYLATAAWATVESSSENTDFTKEATNKAKVDCQLFIDKVIERLGKETGIDRLIIPGNDLTYLAPHDFFLTRCGHGTGFWDKEEIYGKEQARILTEISQEIGGVDCYHVAGNKSKLTF